MASGAPPLFALFLILLTSGMSRSQDASDPAILSEGEIIQAEEGSGTVLRCQVKNVGNRKVIWEFLSHMVIYEGTTLKTNDPIKYSLHVSATGDTSETHMNNLQILNIVDMDQGFYSCYISGTDQRIISRLDVIGIPELPENPRITLNVTDCCQTEQVSSTCIDACVPDDIDLDTFDPVTSCGSLSDLKGLSKCFSQGINHEYCCRVEELSELCIGFCKDEIPTNLGPEHLECILNPKYINGIFDCFAENYDDVPSAPRDVAALASLSSDSSEHSILITWAPPERNADKIVHYKILYKARIMDVYYSAVVSSSHHQYRLQGKEIYGNMDYDIYMVAVALHGVSLGSIELRVFIPDPSLQNKQNADIDECCANHDIDLMCRSELCRTRTWGYLDHDKLMKCLGNLNDVFKCLAGQQNHTNCCMAFGVSPECLPLCYGKAPTFDTRFIVCVQEMSLIEACVQEGYDKLPVPPSKLTLDDVGKDFAQFSFNQSRSQNLQRYVVELQEGGDTNPFVQEKYVDIAKDNFELTELKPDTHYTVRITAETSSFGSLPSESVAFVTYPAWIIEPTPPPVVNVPFNLTECCMNKGMPELCYNECKYSADMTLRFRPIIDTCYAYIGSVLACGADGRNHETCCKEQGVSTLCLELCQHTKDGPLDSKYLACMADTGKAVMCFKEGVVDLPRHPDVYVSKVTKTSITLKWEQPSTSGKISQYDVSYGMTGTKLATITTTNTMYIIQSLVPDTSYDIEIRSQNENGTSSPSPRITQKTLSKDKPEVPMNTSLPVDGHKLWQNITDCCQQSGISQECIPLCENKVSPEAVDSITGCVADSSKMLACYTDGHDHGKCCDEKGLSDVCVLLCRGHPLEPTFDVSTCMSYGNRDMILGCILDNQSLIPGAPSNFRIKLTDDGDVSATWAKPSYCEQDCTFNVYYWKMGDEMNQQIKRTKETILTLTKLEKGMFYTFSVTASNTYGSGRPSNKQTLFVAQWTPSVKVLLRSMYSWVETGDPAQLYCSMVGFNPAEMYGITWKYNDVRILNHDQYYKISDNNRLLHIQSVSEKRDEGMYSCTVETQSTILTAYLFLPIKYQPKIAQIRDDTVEPDGTKTAILACWFKGFPDTEKADFTLDGRILPRSSKYSASVDRRYHTGITSYRLKVADVVAADFGKYSITVKNDYGSKTCTVLLKDPADIPPVNPVDAPPDTKQCCKDANVTYLCQDICTFDTDLEELLADGTYISCLQFFDTFIRCAADNRDHTQCCQDKGVKPFCFPFCYGSSPGSVFENQVELLNCLSDSSTIFDCAKSGHSNLPYPPRDVVLRSNIGNSLQVSWKPPKGNAHKVDHYVIFIQKDGEKEQSHAVNELLTSYVFHDIDPRSDYIVWVQAGNKRGASFNSTKVTWKATVLQGPTGLRVSQDISPSSVTLMWDAVENAQSYTIYYKRSNDVSYKNVPVSGATVYHLLHLHQDTDYTAFVKVRVDNKESEASNEITFKTSKTTLPPPNNLAVSNIQATQVTFTWDSTPGAKAYTLYYKASTASLYKQVTVLSTSYTVENLQENTQYSVYVVVSNPSESQHSKVLQFKTRTYEESKAEKSTDDSNKVVAIGVGVTVAVIGLVAIIFLILFFVFRGRILTPKAHDTVAFENPAFGNQGQIKIEGMSNYDRLEEESQADPVYDNPSGGTSANHSYNNPTYAGQSADAGAATLAVNNEIPDTAPSHA